MQEGNVSEHILLTGSQNVISNFLRYQRSTACQTVDAQCIQFFWTILLYIGKELQEGCCRSPLYRQSGQEQPLLQYHLHWEFLLIMYCIVLYCIYTFI